MALARPSTSMNGFHSAGPINPQLSAMARGVHEWSSGYGGWEELLLPVEVIRMECWASANCRCGVGSR